MQGLSIVPTGEGVPGLVTARHFLGEVDLVEIAIAGLDATFAATAK